MGKRKSNNIIKRYLDFYAAQNTIEKKVFWRIVPLVFFVGIASIIGTIIEGLGTLAILSGVLTILVSLLLCIICYKLGNNNCEKYYMYFCIAFNCVLMPMSYLANGGIHSGMPMYCVCGFLLCSFCTNPKTLHIASSLSFFAYISVFAFSVIHPEIVIPIREDFVETDIVLSFGVASVSVLILISKATIQYSNQRYQDVNTGFIASLGSILEYSNPMGGDRANYIKAYMKVILECANKVLPDAKFNAEEIEMISSAAILMDIGKVAVPDVILQKPGRLTDAEFEIMKNHTLYGCKMIESMKFYQDDRYYNYCYEICRHHHEKYDGSGYPDKLKGEEIPIVSQLAGIVDVYDALTSRKSYKDAYTHETACRIIFSESRGHYSDRILECFKMASGRFEEIMQSYNQ